MPKFCTFKIRKVFEFPATEFANLANSDPASCGFWRDRDAALCYDPLMTPHDQQRFAKLISEFISGCGLESPLYVIAIGSNGSVSVSRQSGSGLAEVCRHNKVGPGWSLFGLRCRVLGPRVGIITRKSCDFAGFGFTVTAVSREPPALLQ